MAQAIKKWVTYNRADISPDNYLGRLIIYMPFQSMSSLLPLEFKLGSTC